MEALESFNNQSKKAILVTKPETENKISVISGLFVKCAVIISIPILTTNLIILINKPNEGHGPTLIRGYKEALKFNPKYIFQMDSDKQIEFSEFSKIYQLKDEYELIIGKRFQRNDPYIRIVISKILRLVIAVFHQVWIIDSNSPFRLMSNKFLRENINKSQNSVVPNIILSILAAKIKKIIFLNIIHNKRETGKISIVKLKLFNICIKSFKDIILFK